MKKDILNAKDFTTRADLEKKVMMTYGLTTEPKEVVIRGTIEELNNLSLSESTTFWGIKTDCTVNKVKKVKKKVDRGERTDYGINKKNYKVKTK